MITHIVHLAFAPDVSEVEKQSLSAQLLALESVCVRSGTEERYIRGITGGINISPEPFNHGLTHTFVLNFESEEDRDWYREDPVHLKFQKELLERVTAVTLLEFEPGVF